jgi:hypothetical protein
MEFLDTEEKRERRMTHIPIGRFGEAVEIAKAVLFREIALVFSCLFEKKLILVVPQLLPTRAAL